MGCITFLLLLLTSLNSVQAVQVLIDTFKNKCPGHDQYTTAQLSKVRFLPGDHATYMSHTITLVKDMVNDLTFEVFPTKCRSKDALDTCETYRSYKMNKVCRFLTAEKTPWSPIVTKYHPRMSCPVKKGIYILRNGTLEASNLPSWTKSYWKVTTVVTDDGTNERIFCNYMEFQIV